MKVSDPVLKPSVLVVGSGPAGLMAAYRAALEGAEVQVIEKMKRPGLKLLAAGGGRCNITNTLPPEDFMRAFGRHGRFMRNALNTFSRDDLLKWFEARGVNIKCADGFHYFPVTGRSADILKVLLEACREYGVKFCFGTKVEKLLVSNGRVCGLRLDTGKEISAEAVILACGGRGYSVLGGSNAGYRLATQGGHRISKPVPGMVGLKTMESWPAGCAGVSLEKVRVSIDLKKYRRLSFDGALIFTQNGISGPAVVDVSAGINELLEKVQEVPLKLELFPGKSPEEVQVLMKKLLQDNSRKKLLNAISILVPNALAAALCEIAGNNVGVENAAGIKTAELPGRVFIELCSIFTGFTVKIVGNQGFDRAMVTRGGVHLKEITPSTLESRLIRQLYFAGEIVNLDGPCGGYNLQWAFSSGCLAGKSAASFNEAAQ